MRLTWSWCSLSIVVALAVAPPMALGQYYAMPGGSGMMNGYPSPAVGPYGRPMAPVPYGQGYYPPVANAWQAPAYRMPAPMMPAGYSAAAPAGPAPFITGYMTPATPAASYVPPNCPAPQPPAAAPAPGAAPAAPAPKDRDLPPAQQQQQPAQDQPAQDQPAQDQGTPPAADAAAQTPEAGTEAAASYAPNMIGDLIGYTARASLSSSQSSSSSAGFGGGSGGSSSSQHAYLPVSQFGAFKISENESPRPQTRIFGTYDYFNNVDGSLNEHPLPSIDVHRETTGFEYAFLNGFASVELRVPFIQTAGDPRVSDAEFGDLTVILKGALYNDCKTQNVLSAGLAITVPTGEKFITDTGVAINPTLLQPWVGGLFNLDRVYVQGFVASVVPTDLRVPVLVNSDLGLGFWLYRCTCKKHFLTGIVPTVEGHANIPVSNRGARNDPIGFPNEGVVTGGMHFIFFDQATLTLGASVPVTGPQPYDVEGTAQFNFRF